MSGKSELRAEYMAKRDAIPPEIRALKSVSVWKNLFGLEEYKNAKTIMLYSDIKSEVRTNIFINKVFSDGKRVLLPVTDIEKGILTPYEIKDMAQLEAGAYGIMEPRRDLIENGEIREVPKDEIDIAVIPGIVFDIFGSRIGYGGGYYDRFLADFKGIKTGLSYTECLHYLIPAEENDICVDMLITEMGCERFGQEI